jgi:uncharacterized OsmC-like protein
VPGLLRMPGDLGARGRQVDPSHACGARPQDLDDRAAETSCVVTMIAMRAAMLGISLDTLEAIVDSESDDRGLLGIDEDVQAGPLSGRVSVRLTAAGADPTTLDEMARWGVKHCPVCDALERPVPITTEVSTV